MDERDSAADLERRAHAEVLAIVSHDIRAPLGVILGAVTELLGPSLGPLNDEQRSLVQLVRRSSEKLGRLAANVLFLNRLTTEKIELRRQRIDLRTIVMRAVESFEKSGELGRLKIAPSYPAESIDVDVDAERATHAVVNVLANAVRFARGEVRVAVVDRDGRGEVAIEDDGPGLRAEQIPLLFDRDARIRSLDAPSPMRGLGLVVAHAIVKAHGAEIAAGSILNDAGAVRGARVTIAWPRAT